MGLQAALLAAGIPLVDKVAAAYGVAAFEALGGFKNVRDVFTWEGHALELDETQYDWGTLYELECETEEPAPWSSRRAYRASRPATRRGRRSKGRRSIWTRRCALPRL